MPSQKQVFSYPGTGREKLLNLAYGAIVESGWTPRYAADNLLVAFTERSWNRYENEIVIECTGDELSITSNMIHGESFDLFGRNKKNIRRFTRRFEAMMQSGMLANPDWNQAIDSLKKETVIQAEAEIKQAEEVNMVMNLSSSNTYLTYSIIGANAIVFILMVIGGAGILSPESIDLIKWGANFKPNTLNGEWWRLISCVFVHIGIIHILFNMYALYMAGVYLEPMLGKIKFAAAYISTGIAASIISLWWHQENVVSAGASGAIFGMYGVFLALLSTRLIPSAIRKSLFQSIGVFVAFNLIYGMKSGIDNAAHVGGLISGLVIGYLFYLDLGKKITFNKYATSLIVAAATVAGTWYFINNYSDDSVEMNRFLNQYSRDEETAIGPLRKSETLTAAEFKKQLEEITLPAWQRNMDIIGEMGKLKLKGRFTDLYDQLKEYTALRIRETKLLISAQDDDTGTYDNELKEVSKKLNEVLKKMNEE